MTEELAMKSIELGVYHSGFSAVFSVRAVV